MTLYPAGIQPASPVLDTGMVDTRPSRRTFLVQYTLLKYMSVGFNWKQNFNETYIVGCACREVRTRNRAEWEALGIIIIIINNLRGWKIKLFLADYKVGQHNPSAGLS